MQVPYISLIQQYLPNLPVFWLLHPGELPATAFWRGLLVLMDLFWLVRAIQQVMFFRLDHRMSVALLLVFQPVIHAVPAGYALHCR